MPTDGSDYYRRVVSKDKCKHPEPELEIWSFGADVTKSGDCEYKMLCRLCGKIVLRTSGLVEAIRET